MQLPTIEAEWKDFERSVMPRNAGQTQRLAMKQAFYAGAFIMLNACIDLGDDSITPQEADAWVSGRRAEIQAFVNKVKSDAANLN